MNSFQELQNKYRGSLVSPDAFAIMCKTVGSRVFILAFHSTIMFA